MILGIDPGKSGGIAYLTLDGEVKDYFKVVDLTPRDIVHKLENYQPFINMCFLERVASMPKQGVRSTFTFGQNFGVYIGILTALKIPFTFVAPGKWQRIMGCMSKGDKNVTKRRAQELFPTLTITHAVADAVLIAEYGRRMEGNRFKFKDVSDI